jgi:hypothetical protein
MKFSALMAVVVLLALSVTPGAAETLKEKMARGAAKTADVAKNAAKQLDQTVTSTVDLAKGEATPDLTRAKLDTMAAESLNRLFYEQPAARAQFEASAGYAVFDSRKSVLLGITAGFGRGVAVNTMTQQRTYMKMGTGGVGLALGLGGFQTQIVILFQTQADFDSFVHDGYDATAQTGAMVGEETAGTELRFVDGRSIFLLSTKGWKVSATAAGTRYWIDPKLN